MNKFEIEIIIENFLIREFPKLIWNMYNDLEKKRNKSLSGESLCCFIDNYIKEKIKKDTGYSLAKEFVEELQRFGYLKEVKP